MIDKRAIIDPKATLASNVTVGPWTYIGADVTIDEGTEIGSHVVIKGPTAIGKNNHIFQFSALGEATQDKKYRGEATGLIIGDRNVIREFSTIHRGTVQDQSETVIGNDNLLMTNVHVAHDCRIANHTIFSHGASCAGHVKVGDYANVGGLAGIHQHCTIGAYAFIAGGSLVVKDVLPFIKVSGQYAEPFGLNVVGLKRNGFSNDLIEHLRQAYKVIYRHSQTVADALKTLRDMLVNCEEIQAFIDGLEQSERGIAR